jgi:hypothetical protein
MGCRTGSTTEGAKTPFKLFQRFKRSFIAQRRALSVELRLLADKRNLNLKAFLSMLKAVGEKGSGTFCAKHPTGRSGKRYLAPLEFPRLCRELRFYGCHAEPKAKHLVFLGC